MKIAKKDISHLDWIYERMRTAHNENHNFDYMIAFRRIIDGLYKEYADYHKPQPDLPAPNTVMWWLCRIADPEIRRKAVGLALWDDPYTGNCQSNDLDTALAGAFSWGENPNYWNEVDHSDLLPEPDFTEYNELRK